MKFKLFWQYKLFTDLTNFEQEFTNYVSDFFMGNITNLDTATGFSLDLIGKIIGVDKRPAVLNFSNLVWNESNWNNEVWNSSNTPTDEIKPISDDLYRRLLQVRSRQLLEPRTINNMIEYIDYIFPTMTWTYTNNVKDVTVDYDGSTLTQEEKAIFDLPFLLIPQGCRLNFVEI